MLNVIKIIKAINVVSCVMFSISLVFLCTADPSKEMPLTQIVVVWGLAIILFVAGVLVNRWTQSRLKNEKNYQAQVTQRRIDRELHQYDNVIQVDFANR